MGLKELWKGKNRKKKKSVKNRRTQIPNEKKFKLEMKRIFLIREEWGAKGLIEKDLLFLL